MYSFLCIHSEMSKGFCLLSNAPNTPLETSFQTFNFSFSSFSSQRARNPSVIRMMRVCGVGAHATAAPMTSTACTNRCPSPADPRWPASAAVSRSVRCTLPSRTAAATSVVGSSGGGWRASTAAAPPPKTTKCSARAPRRCLERGRAAGVSSGSGIIRTASS